MKSFEKDGITFQSHSILEDARLKKAGYKLVAAEKPVEKPEDKNSELTVAELKEVAKDLEITGYTQMSKAELIAAIENAEAVNVANEKGSK